MVADLDNVSKHIEENDQETTTAEEETGTCFTVKILLITKDAQQQHGLRHGDYQRYRSYCSRRLRRLRKSLHVEQGSIKKHFKKKVITVEMLKDEKILYIPLVMAERAWSFGMQLKQEANTELRKRFHLIARLRKAISHAEHLEKLCESVKCDARTKLEGQAYASSMRGALKFELRLWKEAMDNLQKAKTIYENLASVVSVDEKPTYLYRVDELSPSLRYCAYSIGDESALQDLLKMRGQGGDVANLDALISQTREKQAATLSEVEWRGRTVPVTQEKVRTFLLANQEFNNELTRASDHTSKIAVYEALLMESKDAIQVLKDDMRADPTSKTRLPDAPVPSKMYLMSYLSYIRLAKTTERNLLMIKDLETKIDVKVVSENKKVPKPQDIIRLYEIILFNLIEMQQLPGVEEDSDIQDDIHAQTTVFKAFRCYYIALTLTATQRYSEAMAMYNRADHYCQEGLKLMLDETLESKLTKLTSEIGVKKLTAHAYAILGTDDMSGVAKASVKNKKPLYDRLDDYYEDPSLTTTEPNLVKMPPDFEPIPCKPLFFDLTLNNLQFPSLEDKIEQKKTTGITGFVKGLWGWGGKK